MKNAFIAILATAAVGLWAAGSASAVPVSAAGSASASETLPLAFNVGWENVCRDRSILRRDRNGNVVRLLVPMCNMVWIGQRYYYRGNYYADPNFVAQIY
ncbi:MAG TPA: hypothetical protein VIQ29_02350 [Ancylobacter sp.]